LADAQVSLALEAGDTEDRRYADRGVFVSSSR
jgi:hypothetical protein